MNNHADPYLLHETGHADILSCWCNASQILLVQEGIIKLSSFIILLGTDCIDVKCI